jgi:glycosyltransferase involved in cell wall biosynthesis
MATACRRFTASRSPLAALDPPSGRVTKPDDFMRIDLVITELDTGGAEKCCAELAIFLANRGHRVRVIALGPRPPIAKDSLVRFLESNQIELHFLGGKKWWMLPGVVSKLKRLLTKDRPDIVQSFLWHANTVSAWVVPSLGVPLFGGIRVAEPRKMRHALDRWATSRSTKTICVSQGVADWCVQTERINAGKLIVIPNGIAVLTQRHPIPPDSHAVPDQARILLFVGRLNHQKGIDVLVTHAKDLLDRLPEHHLVVIGDGYLRDELDALIERSPSARIHCLGLRTDVREWMARSELLLLPTRYEGMPNVILEAMIEGLTVVTTRVEGVAELLGDLVEQQSVAKGDWNALFALAVTLANASQHRMEIGKNNRERVESEFALEKQLMRYELLYANPR